MAILGRLGRFLRYAAPVMLGVAFLSNIPIDPARLGVEDVGATVIGGARGGAMVWVVIGVGSLMAWPRLWVLAPTVIVIRLVEAAGFVGWSTWLIALARLHIIIPLALIALTSLFRRLPGPLPNVAGTIVPNADGVGALLALPLVILLHRGGHVTVLLFGALGLAGWRVIAYGLKGEALQRGRGWIAFIVGTAGMALYCLYWARPDWTTGWNMLVNGAVPVGVMAWAVQRAVIPWRNFMTTP